MFSIVFGELRHIYCKLSNYIYRQQITLYCGGRRLGQANVSLQSLLPLEKPFISPAKIEALFPLVSAATDSNPASGTTDIPSVGVSVILKSEESFNSSPLDKQVVDNSSCESHVVCYFYIICTPNSLETFHDL